MQGSNSPISEETTTKIGGKGGGKRLKKISLSEEDLHNPYNREKSAEGDDWSSPALGKRGNSTSRSWIGAKRLAPSESTGVGTSTKGTGGGVRQERKTGSTRGKTLGRGNGSRCETGRERSQARGRTERTGGANEQRGTTSNLFLFKGTQSCTLTV